MGKRADKIWKEYKHLMLLVGACLIALIWVFHLMQYIDKVSPTVKFDYAGDVKVYTVSAPDHDAEVAYLYKLQNSGLESTRLMTSIIYIGEGVGKTITVGDKTMFFIKNKNGKLNLLKLDFDHFITRKPIYDIDRFVKDGM